MRVPEGNVTENERRSQGVRQTEEERERKRGLIQKGDKDRWETERPLSISRPRQDAIEKDRKERESTVGNTHELLQRRQRAKE